MFSQLLSALLGASAQPDMTEPDAAHALGALLLRVVKYERQHSLDEIRRIESLLAFLHNLSAGEAARMRTRCEVLEQQAPPTEIFIELVRQGIDFDERLEAMEALWQLVLAEEKVSAEEQALLAAIQTALGLTDADNVTARALALDHM